MHQEEASDGQFIQKSQEMITDQTVCRNDSITGSFKFVVEKIKRLENHAQ